jgi:methylase of polypeptide subunit release factors
MLTIKNNFSQILQGLDFSLNEVSNPEIVFVNHALKNLHPKHYIYLEFAEILEADAVYFKYYGDDRHCIPQVYFYNNESGRYSKQRIAEIHRNVYSSSQVPLIVFIDKIEITLFDARKHVSVKSDSVISNENCIINDVYSISTQLEILKKYFNAKKLNSGEFWESEEASTHFKKNTSAYEKLVEVLTEIKNSFIHAFVKEGITKVFAEELLFKCILIKYLEENGKDEAKNENFAKKFYVKHNLGFNSLNEILTNKKTLELFNALESHFNGNVFQIAPKKVNGDLDEEEKSKQEKFLSNTSLEILAQHLDGNLDSGKQLKIWQEYTFKYVPIELISNFYEEFISKDIDQNKGTVFTPSYLVNLLIDECLPLSEKEEHWNHNVKLADVSCGSGIFITTAFKRLVQRLRVRKWLEAGKPKELPNPTLSEVKEILSQNIFGVDLHPTSVKLTKFSLQLALCQLVPKEELWTWNEDRVFKDLDDKNIFNKDFFDFLIENKNFHNSLDLVIGNPPFIDIGESKFLDYKFKLEKIDFKFKVDIPRYELALMFLEASNLLLKANGNLCYIQKSTSILYNSGPKAKEFRNSLFNQFHVYQVIDFTLLKNDLFKSKSKIIFDEGKPKIDEKGKIKKTKSTSVESCAIFYKKQKVEEYNTLHIISRLLKNTKDGLSFEFDYYDFHEIAKSQVLEDETIWRCNLLGGNRLNHLIRKINRIDHQQTSLQNFLFNELNFSPNTYLSGFKVGNKKNESTYITDNDVLMGADFSISVLKFSRFDKNQKFESIRNIELFSPPFLIIKTTITGRQIPIYLNPNLNFSFDINIIGFKSNDIFTLELIKTKIEKNLEINILKTLSTCSQFYIGSTTAIQKQDLDNWTIPLDGDEIKLSFSERIIMDDVLDYIYPSWYEGENTKVNKPIDSKNILLDFADIFNQSFNSIYKKENLDQKLTKIYEASTFYALEFEYTSEDIKKPEEVNEVESEEQIGSLIQSIYGKSTVINRVLKLYTPNKITLVKPKNLRFWLKSIALRDADDVFDDMIKAGY